MPRISGFVRGAEPCILMLIMPTIMLTMLIIMLILLSIMLIMLAIELIYQADASCRRPLCFYYYIKEGAADHERDERREKRGSKGKER